MNHILAAQLKKMVQKDQKVRKLMDKMYEIDNENRKKLKRIIRKYDFPTKTLVGKDGAGDAWLIVQHADDDVKFQDDCLKLLEKLAKMGEADKRNVAYLTDRVRTNKNLPQVYGTQVSMRPADWKNKKFVYGNLVDPKNLDKRRKEVGLEPFSKYIKRFKKPRG